MDTKEEVFARLDELKEAWVGLDRNPSDETIARNDKLRDIWKKTLSMSHDEYLSRIKRGMDSSGVKTTIDAGKVIGNLMHQRSLDPESDDKNKETIKKGLKDGSLKPKQNAYQ
jgi:hypothetical protein